MYKSETLYFIKRDDEEGEVNGMKLNDCMTQHAVEGQ